MKTREIRWRFGGDQRTLKMLTSMCGKEEKQRRTGTIHEANSKRAKCVKRRKKDKCRNSK